jgi:uncharacterized protein YuzE
MQIKIDINADALYIKLRKGKIAKTKNNGDHLTDYDKKGTLIGFEILNLSKTIPKNERKVTLSEVIANSKQKLPA